MNKIELLGRLVKDVEVQKSKNDKSYVTFTLAVPRKLNKDNTDFIDCIAFGKTAEALYKYTEKGNRVIIDGELHIENFKDKEGNTRKSVCVTVSDFYFVDFKKVEETKEQEKEQLSF